MKNKIYITGHQNPDTDSICSAISYAELKKILGFNAVPIRLGDISRETQFVLDYFKIEAPQYITTVKTRISDLDLDTAPTISPDLSIKNAWRIMKEHTLKFLPVTDNEGKFMGVLSLTDIANKYMDPLENNIMKTTNTSIANILDTLDGELVLGIRSEFNPDGKIIIWSMDNDTMEKSINEGDIVILGNNLMNQIDAIEFGAKTIILTQNQLIDNSLLTKAKEKNCIIIKTKYDTFTSARFINQSLPVGYITTKENLVSFNINDFVDFVKEQMIKQRHKFYTVVDSKQQVKGILSRFNLISHRKKQIILVDHNSKSQSIDGIEDSEIIEIIDHHRVAEVKTNKPIYFRNEPVGSTCTIVSNMYFEHGLEPSKEIAGIMCAAILSDTAILSSPTCTIIDKNAVQRLSKIAEINPEEFGFKMFEAGSILEGKTATEIFYQDFKDFMIGKNKVGIGQINTINYDEFEKMKEETLSFMKKTQIERNYDLLMLLITNVIDKGSKCYFTGDGAGDLISKLFHTEIIDNSCYLEGVISRKKQIIPAFSSILE